MLIKKKINKYNGIAKYIRARLNVMQAVVVSIVIGYRGTLSRATIENIKSLDFSKSDALTASMIVLRSSIEMANEFIDYDHTR